MRKLFISFFLLLFFFLSIPKTVAYAQISEVIDILKGLGIDPSTLVQGTLDQLNSLIPEGIKDIIPALKEESGPTVEFESGDITLDPDEKDKSKIKAPPLLPEGQSAPIISCGNVGAIDGTQRCCIFKETIPSGYGKLEEAQESLVQKGGTIISDLALRLGIQTANPLLAVPAFIYKGIDKIRNSKTGNIIRSLVTIQNTAINLQKSTEQSYCPLGGRPSNINDPACVCRSIDKPIDIEQLDALCNRYVSDPLKRASCLTCAGSQGIWSSVGCLYGDFSRFMNKTLLGWGISLTGIISLLCIIYSAFMLQTSGGNPERIKKAREYLTSCIVGLVVIIFSVFILRIIGISIGIPWFGK